MRRICLAVILLTVASTAWSWDDTRQITASAPSCVAGVQCSLTITPGFIKGQVSADFSGKAPAMAGLATSLRVTDARGTLVRERSPLVASDGSLRFPLADGQTLEAGRYRYTVDGFGSGFFDVISAQSAAAPRTAAAAVGKPTGALVGVWHGIANTPGSLELAANGQYNLNGKLGGHYRQIGDSVVFDGALRSWNGGRARLRDGVLEFQWTNKQGFKNFFVFSR